MSATTTTISRWSIRRITLLATVLLALTAGVLAAYTLTVNVSDTPSGDVPVPFKDGFVPSQPM